MISIEIELDNEKLNDYVIKINYLLFRPFYRVDIVLWPWMPAKVEVEVD